MNTTVTNMMVSTGKIEQHLSDMNGKLVDVNEHKNKVCPENRKEIYSKIDKIKELSIKNGVYIALAQTIVVGVIVALMTGHLG